MDRMYPLFGRNPYQEVASRPRVRQIRDHDKNDNDECRLAGKRKGTTSMTLVNKVRRVHSIGDVLASSSCRILLRMIWPLEQRTLKRANKMRTWQRR
mmetsp:Transcript_1809/g.3528  ORF Transcript_1809/g.3528 Transcript_1809/m.3528 type:complete len:97 (+) Transcript_1809:24-314(+)|eukprot:scaffold11998_cov174-Amphora_coffeaeformis.AAC.9